MRSEIPDLRFANLRALRGDLAGRPAFGGTYGRNLVWAWSAWIVVPHSGQMAEVLPVRLKHRAP